MSDIGELLLKPQTSRSPASLHRAQRQAELGRELAHLQTAEQAQSRQLGKCRVQVFEFPQRIVQGQHVHRIGGGALLLVERDPAHRSATLFRFLAPRMIDQQTSHHLRGEGEELPASLEAAFLDSNQSHVCFVQQRGRLQGVIRTLLLHVALGELSKLVVHQRKEIGPQRFFPGTETTRGCRGLEAGGLGHGSLSRRRLFEARILGRAGRGFFLAVGSWFLRPGNKPGGAKGPNPGNPNSGDRPMTFAAAPRSRCAALAFLFLVAPSAKAQFTSRISVDDFGAESNANSFSPEISGNGRYVTFASAASNLVVGVLDTNGVDDCFVYDTLTQTVERVSVGLFALQGDGHSGVPTISDDGRWVAFESRATNLVPFDFNFREDVFLYDRELDVIQRVSVSSFNQEANNSCTRPRISGDAQHVVFESTASNLVLADNNNERDIFVHDLQFAATTRVSVSSAGVEANDSSDDPSLSADGRYVVFESDASNLVPGDNNGHPDIFLHDRFLGLTTRVSVSSNGVQANEGSSDADISADGRWIAFESDASNLVDIDTNGLEDVFLHDTLTGTTQRLSVSYLGIPTDGDSENPSISADGSVVTFASTATNLVPDDFNSEEDVFRWDRATGAITRVSVDSDGIESDDFNRRPQISPSGRQIVFYSPATTLVPNDVNGLEDIFVNGSLLTLEADNDNPSELETVRLDLWRAEAGTRMMHVLVGVNGVPLFAPIHFGLFAADGTKEFSFAVPVGISGVTLELMSFACCGAGGSGPGVFASNRVSMTVQ